MKTKIFAAIEDKNILEEITIKLKFNQTVN